MKLYCINLKRSVDRRKRMEAEFNRQSLLVDFIEAIDGRHLSEHVVKNAYSRFRTCLRYGTGLSRGEIGCAMSHLEFFSRVIQSCESGFVFEDDVLFSDELGLAISEVSMFLEKQKVPTLVQLPGLERDCVKSLGETIVGPVSFAVGAYAYGINLTAARLLLDSFKPIKMPIDHYSYLIRHNGLRCYKYSKKVLRVDMDSESDVGEDRFSFNPKGFTRLIYKFWRCIGVTMDMLLSR